MNEIFGDREKGYDTIESVIRKAIQLRSGAMNRIRREAWLGLRFLFFLPA